MKIAILLLIIFLILIFFRFLGNMSKINKSNSKKDTVIDLEKDPKTDEYKPKE